MYSLRMALRQVIALLVAELRTLLECMTGHGDEVDMGHAAQQLRRSRREVCFVESSLHTLYFMLHTSYFIFYTGLLRRERPHFRAHILPQALVF